MPLLPQSIRKQHNVNAANFWPLRSRDFPVYEVHTWNGFVSAPCIIDAFTRRIAGGKKDGPDDARPTRKSSRQERAERLEDNTRRDIRGTSSRICATGRTLRRAANSRFLSQRNRLIPE